MPVDERTRHALYDELAAMLTPPSVDALMEYLPPVGWSDVARRSDLDALERRIDDRFTVFGAELRAELRAELHRAQVSQLRWMVATLLTSLSVQAAILLGVVRALG